MCAFFGLTALGMQDPFKVSLDAITHLPIFNDDDFRKAFDRQKSKSKDRLSITIAQLTVAQLPALMEDVYRGPVPRAEYALVHKWTAAAAAGKEGRGGQGNKQNVAQEEEQPIYWNQFLDAVGSARKEAEEAIEGGKTTVGPACGTLSWSEYTTNLRKCKSASRAPPEKYFTPLTAQQEIGWEPPQYGPRKAKTSSEETKFASEMIRCGVYY